MIRVPGAVCVALLWLTHPCRAQGSVVPPRAESSASAQRVRVGRIVFALPEGFVADSAANMMDDFHPPMHEWRRRAVKFLACAAHGARGKLVRSERI